MVSVIVVAGLVYHLLSCMAGMDPDEAAVRLMWIAVPLVALVMPGTWLGGLARSLCSIASDVLARLGGGDPR
ncbi:hypothetical protein [Nocardia goodfellowii]|uniref:Uncharacterized protein n=1 Tax=Nocardia goodfellowii TaxID=882446 RepID=A0ABS4QPH9_9NOCA|nr:hypothetical protein [Nocardia goodfellowii]MBP2193605.1 hypothetical protein [Nocardia goodfellowii]